MAHVYEDAEKMLKSALHVCDAVNLDEGIVVWLFYRLQKKRWCRGDGTRRILSLVDRRRYVDHPSFGAAIISRVLEDEGFRVAVLPQPDWRCDRDFMRFGRPRLAFLVTAGNN